MAIATAACAEDGRDGWLRYAPMDRSVVARFAKVPNCVVVLGDSPVLHTAKIELLHGMSGVLSGVLSRAPEVADSLPTTDCILLGPRDRIAAALPELSLPPLQPDAYFLTWYAQRGQEFLIVAGGDDRGTLYGTFDLLSKMARGDSLGGRSELGSASVPFRWINQWDNLDGSIERGYAGNSIFFESGRVRADLTRAAEYARLLASIGINGCVVNNVNADPHVLEAGFLPQLARIADAFRPYGVRLGLAVNLSTPKQSGELDSFDPLDARVQAWWKKKVDAIYRAIPDFGGVVVKADSEGQLGPSVYGRNEAQAANVIARALAPHGGVVFYRAFIYNHHLDWRDPKADRARAAYDIFHPLDGQFDSNVIVQIKNGPIDFQVREPASPLFGGLPQTSKAIELQITQEYTGQQRHTVYLAPMWKQALDFDMRVEGRRTTVSSLVRGYVGVANVGLDANWLGNHLAMANLYAFGRLAWSPGLTPEKIAEEWTRLTFGNDPGVVRTVTDVQMASWPAYEHYTGPLGLQTLTNITGPHYGPAPESQENNGWGQWIRAEHDGVGMDRSVATGTGFAGQYWLEARKQVEDASTTPDELLLFFHHVPYTYKLHSGKTVIQAIYDSHYEGAERAGEFVREWKTLAGHIDEDRYGAVLTQLEYQADHAIVWRDAINDWFFKVSGIPDARGGVGHPESRIEAESMQLTGYRPVELASWEGASGRKAVACSSSKCSAEMTYRGRAGNFDIAVQYFDVRNGVAVFRMYLNDRLVETWRGDDSFPGQTLSADCSVRHHLAGVALKTGERLRVEGSPNGADPAALDYIELEAHPH